MKNMILSFEISGYDICDHFLMLWFQKDSLVSVLLILLLFFFWAWGVGPGFLDKIVVFAVWLPNFGRPK